MLLYTIKEEYYWEYPLTAIAGASILGGTLSYIQISATHMKIGHLQMKSTSSYLQMNFSDLTWKLSTSRAVEDEKKNSVCCSCAV